MSVIVMEPLVIRGRAPGRAAAPEAIEMEPLVIQGRPLTNRAAGALREAGFTDVLVRTVPGWQRGILHDIRARAGGRPS